jgi:hypothetical protein
MVLVVDKKLYGCKDNAFFRIAAPFSSFSLE